MANNPQYFLKIESVYIALHQPVLTVAECVLKGFR